MSNRRPTTRRSLASRLADLGVLLLGVASVLAVLEMAVRPFYPASPDLLAHQVRHRASPAYGWEMVPDLGANSLAVPAPIDEHGGRLMSPPPGGSGSDRPSWLAAGGGNTFGVGITADSIFAARASRGVEEGGVILVNTATEGYDLDQKLRRIEAEAVRVSPDLILIEVEASDLTTRAPRDSDLAGSSVESALLRINRQPPRQEDTWAWILNRSRLASLVDGRVRAFLRLGRRLPKPEPAVTSYQVRPIDILLGRETPAIESAWNKVEGKMDRLAMAAGRVGATVCVVALPLPAQLRRPYPRANFQSRLSRICGERGFLLVDPLPAFRGARRSGIRPYLPRLPYLSEAGHRVVAEQIRMELETPLAHDDDGRLPGRGDE